MTPLRLIARLSEIVDISSRRHLHQTHGLQFQVRNLPVAASGVIRYLQVIQRLGRKKTDTPPELLTHGRVVFQGKKCGFSVHKLSRAVYTFFKPSIFVHPRPHALINYTHRCFPFFFL